MYILKLKSLAATLAESQDAAELVEAELPPGRTRDVAEQAVLQIRQARVALLEEANQLERYAAEL